MRRDSEESVIRKNVGFPRLFAIDWILEGLKNTMTMRCSSVMVVDGAPSHRSVQLIIPTTWRWRDFSPRLQS
jgi:hypothetical protein